MQCLAGRRLIRERRANRTQKMETVMSSYHVNLIASAVVRRLARRTASQQAAPTLAAAIASAVGRRLMAPRVASVAARGRASAPLPRMSASHGRVASNIARRIASRAPAALTPSIDVGAIDAAKVASATVRRLDELRAKAPSMSDLVASAVARHLALPRLHGSSAAARRLHARVASAVGHALQQRAAAAKEEPERKGGDTPKNAPSKS